MIALNSAPGQVGPSRRRFRHIPRAGALALFLNTLATIQLVWVYLLHTPSTINLDAFEHGAERIPFQYRLLMAFPLRWAHRSPTMAHAAGSLERLHGWLPAHISPESLVQALVNLLCLAAAGIIARQLYQAGTRTRILTPFVYPLTLVLAAFTYALLTTHAFRFVYDLPSVAFFAVGMYLIYFRHHPAWFVLLFVIATVNRETTLLLLPLYAVTQCVQPKSNLDALSKNLAPDPQTIHWPRLYAPCTLLVVLPLAAAWTAWHLFVVHHFAANASAAGPRLLLNLGVLLCPLSWPQLASACGFLCPVVFAWKSRIQDPTLRLWVWLLPAWLLFMLFYGLILEPRVFGELIPLVACAAALIAEESILRRVKSIDIPRRSRVLPFKRRRLS
jgi:hypothetical protein